VLRRAKRIRKDDWRKNPVFGQKMPVYAAFRDPSLREAVLPNPPHPSSEPSKMSRKQISLVLALVASLAVTACGTSPTAPSHDEPIIIVGSGG
jgi:hypothetical protein